MIAQYRPDIARALEQTVVNLKGLEQTLEILRSDLATLAHSIGHPQAAQFVLAPTRSLGIVGAGSFNPGAFAQHGVYGQPGYGAYGNIWALPGYGTGFQAPNMGVPSQIGVPNVGTPFIGPTYGFPTIGTPNVAQPNVAYPYAQLYR